MITLKLYFTVQGFAVRSLAESLWYSWVRKCPNSHTCWEVPFSRECTAPLQSADLVGGSWRPALSSWTRGRGMISVGSPPGDKSWGQVLRTTNISAVGTQDRGWQWVPIKITSSQTHEITLTNYTLFWSQRLKKIHTGILKSEILKILYSTFRLLSLMHRWHSLAARRKRLEVWWLFCQTFMLG